MRRRRKRKRKTNSKNQQKKKNDNNISKNKNKYNKKKEPAQKTKQAKKNPYSEFAEKDKEVVMDDDFVVFTKHSSSDQLQKSTLPR